MNNISLVGRLTKDVDLRYTASGKATASFNLAVNRTFKNKEGNYEADFINCVIWGDKAERLAQFTQKGSQIGVTGRIQTRNYENQQGQRVYVTEVVAENFELLDSRKQNEQNQPPQNNNFNQQGSLDGTDPFAKSAQIEIGDDDLPF